jgi:argininosuccinate synthase
MRFADLKDRKVGICASGGLVSTFIAQRLKEEGIAHEQFIVDIGQPADEEFSLSAQKNRLLRAAVRVDLREEIATSFLHAVRAQAQYDGGYWNTTGIARAVTVRGLVAALRSAGCAVFAHGAVHGGNDEFRFTYYLQMFAPEIQPFSPWEDASTAERFKSRTAMGDFIVDADPETIQAKAGHSVDGNVGGVSHENREVEFFSNDTASITPIMGVAPSDAPDVPQRCSIRFAQGIPVEFDGQPVTAFEALTLANAIAGRNGVVLKSVLENRMNGTKGRGLYESPGLDLLGSATRQLLQATVDRDSWEMLRFLSPFIARQTYAGRLFDPATQAALQTVRQLAENADGTVDVKAFKGTYTAERVRDYKKTRFTAQQFRFQHGGQRWITEYVA